MMTMHTQLSLYSFESYDPSWAVAGNPDLDSISSFSFSRLWKIRFIHSYCFESKVTTCLNTVDPESLQRGLLLRISDFSVLVRTLQWLTDTYIYIYISCLL